jgi:hypothetical protein
LRSDESLDAQSLVTVTLGNNIRRRDFPEVSFAMEESISYTVRTPEPGDEAYPVVQSGTLKGSRSADFSSQFDNSSGEDARSIGLGNPVYIEFKYEGYNGGTLPALAPVSSISVVERKDNQDSALHEVLTFERDSTVIRFSYTPKAGQGVLELIVIPKNTVGGSDVNTARTSGSYLNIKLVERPVPIANYTAEYTGGNIKLTTTNGNAAVSGIKVVYTSRGFDHAGAVTPGIPDSMIDPSSSNMNVTKTWTSLPVFAASWAFD